MSTSEGLSSARALQAVSAASRPARRASVAALLPVPDLSRFTIGHRDGPEGVQVCGQPKDGGRDGADEDDDRPGDRDETGRDEVVTGVARDARGDGADRVRPW